MTAKLGYLLVSVGTAVTFGGVLKWMTAMGSTRAVLLWVGVAVIGVIVLAAGTSRVVAASGAGAKPDPEKAPGKTGSWHGWE